MTDEMQVEPMILLDLRRILLIAVAAVAGTFLARQYGIGTAIGIWAAFTAVSCGIGALLLRTSSLNRITWRNHVAGCLIPWGWRLNRGLLWPAAVISWCVWIAIAGTAMALLTQTGESPSLTARLALFVAWVVNAGAILFLAGTLRQATPGSRVGSLWKLTAFIAGILSVSVGLYFTGHPRTALLIGAGPPVVIGGIASMLVAYMLTFGRNTRWN